MLLILSNVCAKKIIQGIISNTYQQSTIFECATNHDIQNIIRQCRIDGHLFRGIERPEIFLIELRTARQGNYDQLSENLATRSLCQSKSLSPLQSIQLVLVRNLYSAALYQPTILKLSQLN